MKAMCRCESALRACSTETHSNVSFAVAVLYWLWVHGNCCLCSIVVRSPVSAEPSIAAGSTGTGPLRRTWLTESAGRTQRS